MNVPTFLCIVAKWRGLYRWKEGVVEGDDDGRGEMRKQRVKEIKVKRESEEKKGDKMDGEM